jgi:hypothetical protein
MIKLYDGDTDAEIGQINESQLESLAEQLVEESLDEYSYNINPSVLASLESNGVDPEVVGLLRKALGGRTSMEVRYEID